MSGLVSIATALVPMLLASATPRDEARFEAPYLFNLSTNFGSLPLMGAFLSWDPEHAEMYVTGDGSVRVFNDSGMQVYAFAEDEQVGGIARVAALEGGDLLVQAFREGRLALLRLSYRGELLKEIVPQNVPAEFDGAARHGFMRYRDGRIYLADLGAMRVVVLDLEGNCLQSWDLAERIEETAKRADLGVRGFNLDGEGNILFTVQALFKAYVLAPDGSVRSFGVRGSAPGKFNVMGGIARDDAGYFYVADILKSAVLVFDKDLQFVREFGYRGRAPGNLVAPEDLAVGKDKLYVSQNARRGVSVFKIAQQ